MIALKCASLSMENLGNRDKMVTIHQFMCYTNSGTIAKYVI